MSFFGGFSNGISRVFFLLSKGKFYARRLLEMLIAFYIFINLARSKKEKLQNPRDANKSVYG